MTLEIIKKLDNRSDHNKKFSKYDHAIFPVKRLDWSKQYRAQVSYRVGSREHVKIWAFRTRDLNVPTYELRSDNEVIKEKSGNAFAVYLPPKHQNDAELAYSTRYRGLSALDVQIIDGNTLMIKATGSGDAEIILHGVSIKIVI